MTRPRSIRCWVNAHPEPRRGCLIQPKHAKGNNERLGERDGVDDRDGSCGQSVATIETKILI